jgi:hypothetical protein
MPASASFTILSMDFFLNRELDMSSGFMRKLGKFGKDRKLLIFLTTIIINFTPDLPPMMTYRYAIVLPDKNSSEKMLTSQKHFPFPEI